MADHAAFEAGSMHPKISVKNTFIDICDQEDMDMTESHSGSKRVSAPSICVSAPHRKSDVMTHFSSATDFEAVPTSGRASSEEELEELEEPVLPEYNMGVTISAPDGHGVAKILVPEGHAFAKAAVQEYHVGVKNTFIDICTEDKKKNRGKRHSEPCINVSGLPRKSDPAIRMRVPKTVDEEGPLASSCDSLREEDEDGMLMSPQTSELLVTALNTDEAREWASTDRQIRGFNSTSDRAALQEYFAEDELRTTVMIRGMPEAMTRSLLEELLDREGFYACYNFMYVPADLSTGLCFCHAFINMFSPEEAQRFRRHFTGFTNWPIPCQKEGAVDWSEALQGLDELVGRYRNSPLMHKTVAPGLRPAIYRGGVRTAFPPATIALKAPRARRSGQKKNLERAAGMSGLGVPPMQMATYRGDASCRTPLTGFAR